MKKMLSILIVALFLSVTAIAEAVDYFPSASCSDHSTTMLEKSEEAYGHIGSNV